MPCTWYPDSVEPPDAEERKRDRKVARELRKLKKELAASGKRGGPAEKLLRVYRQG